MTKPKSTVTPEFEAKLRQTLRDLEREEQRRVETRARFDEESG